MTVQDINISLIKPYKNNAKRHTDTQIANVAESIRQFGWAQPIVVDRDYTIIIGHCRYSAAKRLGLTTVPVVVAADLTDEQRKLSQIARDIYARYGTDGKYILDGDKLIICQSNAKNAVLRALYPNAIINPLGEWTGGTDVDTGATNRKLGSDMGDSVTGGGLHGKDLSKADVSVNIYAFIKAQLTGEVVELCCAIGDETVDGKPYSEIVEKARQYIQSVGGFEKFAEWGLI